MKSAVLQGPIAVPNPRKPTRRDSDSGKFVAADAPLSESDQWLEELERLIVPDFT